MKELKLFVEQMRATSSSLEKVEILKTFEIAVVNLSNLNSFLMKQLNYCVRSHIIIISCNHNDFWKKTKL